MFVKKTGYVIGSKNNPAPNNCYPAKITKVGYVLRQSGKTHIVKNIGLTDIRLRGNIYYQVIVNAGACEACAEHNGAIYPIADAKEGVNLPPFHPKCKCSIQEYSSVNPNYDPWRGEVLLWLDIMYGDGTLEQKAQKLLEFYGWTEFSAAFIADILLAINDIEHIGKRMEAFFSRLENPSAVAIITPEDLNDFGWHDATQDEANRLMAAFAKFGITSRESMIQFLASVWWWSNIYINNKYQRGVNEFIEEKTEAGGDPFLIFLRTAYYAGGSPGGDFDNDMNDAIAGKISYELTADYIKIRGIEYLLPSRWKDRLEAYEKAQEIW